MTSKIPICIHALPSTWVATISAALERGEMTEAEQDEVNTAMAWVQDALYVTDDEQGFHDMP
ncbi:MAG: hypothetical protein WCH05_06530 [Chlorobiaceae bacterium]